LDDDVDTGTGSVAHVCRRGAVGDAARRQWCQTRRLTTFLGRQFCLLPVASDNECAISDRAEIRDLAAAAGATASHWD